MKEEETYNTLKEIIIELTYCDDYELEPKVKMSYFGMDSDEELMLVKEINSTFGIELSYTSFGNKTIKKLESDINALI